MPGCHPSERMLLLRGAMHFKRKDNRQPVCHERAFCNRLPNRIHGFDRTKRATVRHDRICCIFAVPAVDLELATALQQDATVRICAGSASELVANDIAVV